MSTPYLVSRQEAKWHLNLTDEQSNAEIDFRILVASSTILDYLKIYDPDVTSPQTHNDFWDDWQNPANVPFEVKAAVLLVMSEFNDNREAGNANIISPAIKSLLARWRDPALA